jgi:hypothetical protein
VCQSDLQKTLFVVDRERWARWASSESRIKAKANSHVMVLFCFQVLWSATLDLKAHCPPKGLVHVIGRPIFCPSKFISASMAFQSKPVGNTGRRVPSPFAIFDAHVLEDSASRAHCLAMKSHSFRSRIVSVAALVRLCVGFTLLSDILTFSKLVLIMRVSVRDKRFRGIALWVLVIGESRGP